MRKSHLGLPATNGSFKKGHKTNLGKKNNWQGGISRQYKLKNASRLKPKQCEVCGAMGRICFDHDHKTGKFRGWICIRCNSALGMVKDNAETLIALAEYLKEKGRNG